MSQPTFSALIFGSRVHAHGAVASLSVCGGASTMLVTAGTSGPHGGLAVLAYDAASGLRVVLAPAEGADVPAAAASADGLVAFVNDDGVVVWARLSGDGDLTALASAETGVCARALAFSADGARL